ncbi:lysozyme inhibitor LprI family protein [Ferruginibacter albus]|uniref:lysozyme inhibitor LprI family protein n=1 Tax=Ferruginibacter albus TaxID=2875540 RepID=UPI001CC50A4A|nr:lysozyme inhibitor LprI family protein [Ferruginibacter albus]UAY52965.1 lysozyme inhibitor LprI family protein [Ferruginibacter albus]
MTNLKIIKITFLFCLTYLAGFSQTIKTIDSLETQYQSCLDQGDRMLRCSETFYYQIDSLLNVRYKKLRSMCDSTQKKNLKSEQLAWLSKRDKQFKSYRQQVYKEAKKGGYNGGEDETMIITDKNAQFVKARLIELIKSLPKDYSIAK